MGVRVWIVWAIALAATLVVLWRAATGYFFLFDDFALVSAAMSQPLATLLSEPLIGFYRPAGFALLWLSARFFGWESPIGFIGVSILIHAINAGLCYALARALTFDRLSAAFAGLFFLLSPWSTEGFLWLSATFDRLATCGVLASLLCLRRLAGAPAASTIARAGLILAGLVSALVALFAKESAIVLPAFAIVWAIALGDSGDRRRLVNQAVHILIVAILPVLIYLAVRARVIGAFSGAYGEIGALWSRATLVTNLRSYARHFLLPPLPKGWSTPSVIYHVGFVYPFLGAVAPAILWRGLTGRRRLVLGCAICVLLALAPVAWVGLPTNSTVSGRFVYLAGVWLALGLAAALGALVDWLATQPSRRVPELTAIAVIVTCGYHLGSLTYQAEMWRRAAGLSRSVMAQMDRYRGAGVQGLHIVNLPEVAEEGPWILKGYAFRLYRGGAGMPSVRADLTLVRLSGGIQQLGELGPDPFGDYQASEGRAETPVTLQLVPVFP